MSLSQQDRELLRSLVQDALDVRTVTVDATTRLKELDGIDSMKVLSLVGAVERSFQVDLGFEAVPQIETLVDLERLVVAAQAVRAARAARRQTHQAGL